MRLIDADYLLGMNEDEPMVWDDNDDYMLGQRNMWRDWIYEIKNAPIIDPTDPIRHSYWIDDGHHMQCYNCKEWLCNSDREGHTIPRTYCPNCGCLMDKKEYNEIN